MISPLNRNTNNLKVIAAVLVGALYPNVVQVRTPETKYQTSMTGTIPQSFKPEDIRFATKEDGYVSIHPSSVNFKCRRYESPYLVRINHKLEVNLGRSLYSRPCNQRDTQSFISFIPSILKGMSGARPRILSHWYVRPQIASCHGATRRTRIEGVVIYVEKQYCCWTWFLLICDFDNTPMRKLL